MSADSPKTPREELEARLTALLLGELSAEDAAALRHNIKQDPELARLENQLKETIGLVRQAAASKDEKTIEPAAALQLSAERREKLLASFKTTRLEIPTKKPRRTLRLNRELLKLAAMAVALLLVSGVVVSNFAPMAKSRAQRLDRGLTLRLWSGEDSSPAQVTTINGSEQAVVSFERSDSPASQIGNKPDPALGLRAGEVSSTPIETGRTPARQFSRVGPAAGFPPPAASPAPADKQLAQNAYRFRSTIALPTSSEAQPPGATSSDPGELSTGTFFAGVPHQAREYAGVSVNRRSGLAGRQGGFGGGGGGLGGGRGPAVTPEEK